MKNKIKQTISEIVGAGHPDKVADRIAEIINKHATTSACEVVINSKICLITGEVVFANRIMKQKAHRGIRLLLDNLVLDNKQDMYDDIIKPPIQYQWITQDPMLANRKKQALAGDQEIVYCHQLDKNDAHYILQKIAQHVDDITGHTLDYKILLNLENKTANLSISTNHRKYHLAKKYILIALGWYVPKNKINVCEYAGGSIWNDTGVTGRKIIAENYGTGFAHGGGAIYGKDKTKTAPAGMAYAKKLAKQKKYNSVIVVYYPGDPLNQPNYVIGIKDSKRELL